MMGNLVRAEGIAGTFFANMTSSCSQRAEGGKHPMGVRVWAYEYFPIPYDYSQ